MKPDTAHEATDKLLAEMERKVAETYRQTVRDAQEKLDDYLRRFAVKDEIWQRRVAVGEVSAEEYAKWRMGQIMINQRWGELRDTLAEDYHNANMIARSIVNGYMPEVYALNHNYVTFEIEKAGRVDTSYTLYSRETVERILRDNPELLPPPGPRMRASIAAKRDIAWQEGQLQSVMLDGIKLGESIPNLSKRIATEMGETNHARTIRYARTAATGAQNAGREDAYRRAEALGVEMQRKWIATLDMRTRHEHRVLDGQVRDVDEPFEVDGYEIMYPGDPSAEGFLIWNCRCTTRALVKGWESRTGKLRDDSAIEGMSYEEWKESHVEKPRSITHQEEVAEGMKWRYIHELYKGR